MWVCDFPGAHQMGCEPESNANPNKSFFATKSFETRKIRGLTSHGGPNQV
jgi:hypothetical protein